MKFSKELLLRMLKLMLKIRYFEINTADLNKKGIIPGFTHLYIGEEAIAVGACLAINKDDFITSTHRGHGHVIAKGANLEKMIAELLGRKKGYCKGKGGSMHIADISLGILGANGIVGGGIPIATGAGLAAKMKGTRQVVICFFGDGAVNQGIFHESLNLASIWRLPVIYLCENNLYALSTSQKSSINIENIAERSKAYNIPGIIADGMNVKEIFLKVSNAVSEVRDGYGPILIEAKTYRFLGHHLGDPNKGYLYRSKEEIEYWEKNKCPIKRLKHEMIKNNSIRKIEVEQIEQDIISEIKKATENAKLSPLPASYELYEDLFCVNN